MALAFSALAFAGPIKAQSQAPAANPLGTVPDALPTNVPYGAPVSVEQARTVIAAGVAEAKNGELIGTIGVSGGTGSQDEVVAKAGTAALK